MFDILYIELSEIVHFEDLDMHELSIEVIKQFAKGPMIRSCLPS